MSILRYTVLVAIITNVIWSQPTEDPDTTFPGYHSDTTNSELKPQIDSALSILKRTGKYLKKKINKLADALDDSSSGNRSPDYLEQQIRKKFNELTRDQNAPLIKPWELMKLMDDSNLILVDVRQPEEQAVSMIPGAFSPQEFSNTFTSPSSLAGKAIITYGTISYRSGIYADQLFSMGLPVRNLQGGLLAWTHIKGPLIRKDEKKGQVSTKEVHIYSEEWNYVHPDYTAIW
jgi:rhodanese-related sulfurtransferase